MAGKQEVKRGEMYHHDDHGRVEVTGIWRDVRKADSAHRTDDSDIIIVNYAPEDAELQVNELTDTLDEFLEKPE